MGSIRPAEPRNEYAFSLRAEEYAPAPAPSLTEWQQLWSAWDLVTRDMISDDLLYKKPLPLQNDLIFYLGHVPNFEDLQLSRALSEAQTAPQNYRSIFGHEADRDGGSLDECHDHSRMSDDWPNLGEILDYQQKVRQRIIKSYKTGKSTNRTLQRALWIGFEHECLHLEMFMNMIMQSDAILPPPGITRPSFKYMAMDAQSMRVENQWIKIPTTDVVLGINPTEDGKEDSKGPERYYSWDNERPLRQVTVPEFEAKARPVTNEEYVKYLMSEGSDVIPASWIQIRPTSIDYDIFVSDDETAKFIRGKAVRTVWGPLPLQYALDWPVTASYDELSACVEWMGGRIPTLEQARAIHTQVEEEQRNIIPNLQLDDTRPDPLDVFVDMEGENVGLNYFHPTPITHRGSRLCSPLGGMGGAWEQTSTRLEWFDGFKPMDIYPGYTADSMRDSKNRIVIGGSWATPPRIAGRKSL